MLSLLQVFCFDPDHLVPMAQHHRKENEFVCAYADRYPSSAIVVGVSMASERRGRLMGSEATGPDVRFANVFFVVGNGGNVDMRR